MQIVIPFMAPWLIGLAFVAWWLIGWLPSRIMKHYFLTAYPTQPYEQELGDVLWGFAGPLILIGTLIYRKWCVFNEDIPWGWKW